jgi:transcriptional regulator with XRE-family HTH domain
MILGETLREMREQRGMNARELAAASDIAQRDIRALEAGHLDPTYDLLLALAEGLGVQPSALLIRAEEIGAKRRQ